MESRTQEEALAKLQDYLAVQTTGTIVKTGHLERMFQPATGYAIKQLLVREVKIGTLRAIPKVGYAVVRHEAKAVIESMLFARMALGTTFIGLIVDNNRDASSLGEFQADLEIKASSMRDAIARGVRYDIDVAALDLVRADMDMHRALADIAGYAPLARVVDFMRDEMRQYLVKDVKKEKRISEIVAEHRAWSQPLIDKEEPPPIRRSKAILAYQIHLDMTGKDATSRLLKSQE